jgi:diacylglycerol kinase (ATP)
MRNTNLFVCFSCFVYSSIRFGDRMQAPALPPNNASPHKSRSGFVRIVKAIGYSMEGFATALKHEHAFRQELLLCVVLLPFAIFLPLAPLERVVLIASLLLVLITELLNSSIEAIVDRVSLENHELSKRAKDLGSAAVFLSLTVVAVAWVLIAGPVLWIWLKTFLG